MKGPQTSGGRPNGYQLHPLASLSVHLVLGSHHKGENTKNIIYFYFVFMGYRVASLTGGFIFNELSAVIRLMISYLYRLWNHPTLSSSPKPSGIILSSNS